MEQTLTQLIQLSSESLSGNLNVLGGHSGDTPPAREITHLVLSSLFCQYASSSVDTERNKAQC